MDKYIQKLNFDFLSNQRIVQLIAAIDVMSTREDGMWLKNAKIAT